MPTRPTNFFRRLLFARLVVAVPLVALVAHSLWTLRRADLEDTRRVLHARAGQAASLVDDALDRIERILEFLGSRPGLKAGDAQACLRFIRGLESIDPILANAGVIDLHGTPPRRAVDNGRGHANFAERAWFRQAQPGDGPVMSSPYQAAISGNWQFNVMHPRRDNAGQCIGILVAAIDLGTLAERLFPVSDPPAGSVAGLVAPDGTVLAINRGRADWVGQPLPGDVFGLFEKASV